MERIAHGQSKVLGVEEFLDGLEVLVTPAWFDVINHLHGTYYIGICHQRVHFYCFAISGVKFIWIKQIFDVIRVISDK